MLLSPDRLASYFIEACSADVAAIKPGNVSLYAPDRGMTAEDFVFSAKACAADLCTPELSLGERIYKAVVARHRVVNHNTNLGIILLCAPLAHFALETPIKLGEKSTPVASARCFLGEVLENTTVADAEMAYRAINLATAGGLGQVPEQDLSAKPDVNLRATMALAAAHDLIATQYTTNYALIFDELLPLYLAMCRRWGYNLHPVTGIYLTILSRYPDSLISRKSGAHKAEVLRRMMQNVAKRYNDLDDPNEMRKDLIACDTLLKSRKLNPGTSADIVVACIFLAKIIKSKI